MKSLRKVGLIAAAALVVLALGGAGSASALVEPITGQPGAGSKGQLKGQPPEESNNHCGEVNPVTKVSAVMTPGKSGESNSTHNPTGTASEHYAGNPGTSSLKNSNSTAAVSQYDISCVNATRVAAK